MRTTTQSVVDRHVFHGTRFAEHGNAEQQAVQRKEGDTMAAFGANLPPVDWNPRQTQSHLFRLTYERAREALATIAVDATPDGRHAHELHSVDPATSRGVMPTMGAFMQLMPAGFAGATHRQTDATIFVCIEGRGETRIGEQTLRWGPRDVLVAPSWFPIARKVEAACVLFPFSDRPQQEALGLWHEARGQA